VTDQSYPISSTSSAQYFSFNLNSAKSLAVTITPINNVRVELFFGCSLITSSNCNGQSCVISRVYSGEALSGKYSVVVTPTAGASSFNIEASTGSNNCFNVSLDLNFCKNYINGNQLYNVRDVIAAETIAQSAYVAFSAIYNNTCGDSLKQFVCSYNFQACDATGLTKKLCKEDCQTVTQVCGSNPCVNSVCDEFSGCSVTTTGGGTNVNTDTSAGTSVSVSTMGGENNALSLISSIFIVFILIATL